MKPFEAILYFTTGDPDIVRQERIDCEGIDRGDVLNRILDGLDVTDLIHVIINPK